MKSIRISLLAGASILAAGVAQADTVEVIHWWTSGGEAAALNVLKENLEAEGVSWEDSAVAGGGGDNARTVLQARVAAGDAPTSMQMLGLVIQDYASDGILGNLNDLAAEEGWDDVVPPALQAFMKYEGDWVAAPVNMHSTNWVWVNAELFEQVGGEIPTNFTAFMNLAAQFEAAGVTPLAHGGQAWQEATMFDGAVLSAGGPDFYRSAFIDLDLEALGSDTMVEAFDQMRALRGMVDENFSGRDWNLASAMVINGEAGMQIMGDWAKGEFLNAGLVAGEDFICFRYPGTQGGVTFNSDAFAMFDVGEEGAAAQGVLAANILDPGFQEAFNLVKGSVPARTDVAPDNFDACGQKGMLDVVEATENGALLGSMAHGHAAPEAVKGAIYDVVTEFFNSDMSSRDAAAAMVEAVEFATF